MSNAEEITGLRVLVVEDDLMISMLVEDMLQDLGCRLVGPAARLDDAMALAKSAEFDCAILDLNLAGVSAAPVADVLRERGAPFAFATGYGDAALDDAVRGALVLSKPFQQGDLARILRQLVEPAT